MISNIESCDCCAIKDEVTRPAQLNFWYMLFANIQFGTKQISLKNQVFKNIRCYTHNIFYET